MPQQKEPTFTGTASAILLYQAGIANVICYRPHTGRYQRVLQTDFGTAATFCDGLSACGIIVEAAWCNEAGDIMLAKDRWKYNSFSDAPFCESFAQRYLPEDERE